MLALFGIALLLALALGGIVLAWREADRPRPFERLDPLFDDKHDGTP